MAHKVKALQQWCKVRCEGYRDVEITNFTSSWKSGLAFCAIIHRYRPDLIDYDSLKKEDTYGNSKKAFDVALGLGIAALLDPEDMVAMAVPDKLCIITYVAQYYNFFHNKEMLGGPGVKSGVKRPMGVTSPEPKKNFLEKTNEPAAVTPFEKQVSPAAKRRTIEDRCCMCQGKVYLLERHYSGGKLYHRHCCREAERSSTLKLNKENCGPPGDKKESLFGGRLTAANANKKQSVFGGTNSTVKEATVAPTVSKPSSTNIMKSLFVPSKYVSGTSGVNSEVSKVPADTPKTVATASSGTSTKLSPFVPTTTSSPARTSVWGLTTTTSTSNPVSPSTPNYSTTTTKSSTPGTTTTVSSKWFEKKNPTQPSRDATTVNTPKTTGTTPTTAASSIFASKSALSSGSKWTPSTVSPAVTTSSNTSKYTSIFASRTTPASAGVATTVQSGGYISTITTTVSGQGPSTQTGLKDVTFTLKLGDSKNTPTILNTKNTPTTVSSVSGTSNKTVASTFLVSKSPSALGPGGKGAAEALKSGSDTSPKAEWQLEAERRQKMRNGAYVDPEKYPQRKNEADVTLFGLAEKERNDEKKETDLKRDTERASARQSLVTLLQKQLNPKEPNKIPSTVIEEVSPQTQKEDSKVHKKENEYDDTKPSMSRTPAFRVPDAETGSVETHPLSPPEMWKKVVVESNIGFINTDKTTEPSRRPSFESSPPSFAKQTHKIENPNVPKRKVNAEEKISVDHINKKLVTLDQQLRVVEAQGRKLEDKIRGETDEAMDEDEEEVMIEWFALVKQKYELVRDESDLMYRRRQQELEELHEELEYQYRCMISKPDDEKTYDERKYERELLAEIVEIVKLRDNIVNSIEVDRQRYIAEDEKIKSMMEASGIHDSGKGKKKRRKNKKKQFVEKGGTQTRKSWFKRSSVSKTPTAKDIE